MYKALALPALALALVGATSAPAPAPPPPAAPSGGASLNTGSYTVEGKDLTWNQKTGEFTIPNDVKFTQPGTDVTGDRAQGNSIQKKVTITGHVVLHNSKPVSTLGVTSKNASGEPQTLTTDELQVDGPAKIYIAIGNVKFVQGQKTVTADRGQLNQNTHILDLLGHVHIDDASNGQSMVADSVHYDTQSETVTANGAPFQIRAPAQQETLAPGTMAPTKAPRKR